MTWTKFLQRHEDAALIEAHFCELSLVAKVGRILRKSSSGRGQESESYRSRESRPSRTVPVGADQALLPCSSLNQASSRRERLYRADKSHFSVIDCWKHLLLFRGSWKWVSSDLFCNKPFEIVWGFCIRGALTKNVIMALKTLVGQSKSFRVCEPKPSGRNLLSKLQGL